MAAISTEDTRYYVNGVHAHHVEDWTWRFVATDGYRLMVVDVPLPDAEGELPGDFIISRRFLMLAMAAFAKPGGGLRFEVGRASLVNRQGPDMDLRTDRPRVAM